MKRIIREARPTDMTEIMKVMDAARKKVLANPDRTVHQYIFSPFRTSMLSLFGSISAFSTFSTQSSGATSSMDMLMAWGGQPQLSTKALLMASTKSKCKNSDFSSKMCIFVAIIQKLYDLRRLIMAHFGQSDDFRRVINVLISRSKIPFSTIL